MLDDAYHFLSARGLVADHCTAEKPPQFDSDDKTHIVNDWETSLPSKVHNAISSSEPVNIGPSESPPKMNDTPNGKSSSIGFDATIPGNVLPKILVWSTGDESGINRMMDIWQEHFLKMPPANKTEEITYMDKLAYTLDHRRSSLPWKSFALVDSASKLTRIKDLISRPIRSSEDLSIGFIFTGQGAVYNGMGVALLGYPVFRDTLKSFDRELMRLGCEWSVFGKSLMQTHHIQWRAGINKVHW